jgi:beta-glucosidase
MRLLHVITHAEQRQIDRLCEEGIEPWITIYHWDTPIELHRRYGGWVDHPQFFKDWLNYCRICFDSFGDKCTNWWTINEVGSIK